MQARSKKPAIGSSQAVRSPDQAQRFIDAARELGCDESEERFIATVKKLGSAPPVPHKKVEKQEKKPAK